MPGFPSALREFHNLCHPLYFLVNRRAAHCNAHGAGLQDCRTEQGTRNRLQIQSAGVREWLQFTIRDVNNVGVCGIAIAAIRCCSSCHQQNTAECGMRISAQRADSPAGLPEAGTIPGVPGGIARNRLDLRNPEFERNGGDPEQRVSVPSGV